MGLAWLNFAVAFLEGEISNLGMKTRIKTKQERDRCLSFNIIAQPASGKKRENVIKQTKLRDPKLTFIKQPLARSKEAKSPDNKPDEGASGYCV